MSSCWAASVSAEGRGGGQVCPGSRGRGGREEEEGQGEEEWLRRSAQRPPTPPKGGVPPLGKASRTLWWRRGVLATFSFQEFLTVLSLDIFHSNNVPLLERSFLI